MSSFYELSMEFHSAQSLQAAVNELATHVQLQPQPTLTGHDTFQGALFVTHDLTLPCTVTCLAVENEAYWLDIAIRTSAFEQHFTCNYPLQLNAWLADVDAALIELALVMYDASPFALAMIGEEVSGAATSETLTAAATQTMTCLLPHTLQQRLQVQGQRVTTELTKTSAS